MNPSRRSLPPPLPPVSTTGPGPRRADAVARSNEAPARPVKQGNGPIRFDTLQRAIAATVQAVASGVQARQDSVQLTHLAFETALRQIQALAPGASPRDRADAAVAVASTCLLTPDDVKKLEQVDSGTTKTLKFMKMVPKSQTRNPAFLAIDHTMGRGQLDPRFSDASNNQVHHIAFFLAAGYVSGGRPDQSLKALFAGLYHETLFDKQMRARGGGSREDYVASIHATLAGEYLKLLRNQGKGALIPTVIAGFMARSLDMVPRRLPASQHQEAMKVARELRDMRQALAPLVENPIATGMIGRDNATMSHVVKHTEWLMDLLVNRHLPR